MGQPDGGGSGVEWYFGYKYDHMDLNAEDWRSRRSCGTRHAMLSSSSRTTCRSARWRPTTSWPPRRARSYWPSPARFTRVYLPEGGSTQLELGEGQWNVAWYDPRNGGELQAGSVETVAGPGKKSLGRPAANADQDWAILVKKN